MDKILKYFMENSEREFHIRELAKLMKKSPTTVSKYLDKLNKKGILKSRRKLNHLLFRADTENPFFKDLKLSHNVGKIRQSGLIDYLVEKFNNPEAVILFGSFAKAENIPRSDIDFLIVTPLKKEVRLQKFEKILGHGIQLFLHSNTELREMRTSNKNLLNNFVNGIILYGFWELFK